MLFAFSVEGRVGDFLKQDVRFTVDHAIALANDRLPDGLGWIPDFSPSRLDLAAVNSPQAMNVAVARSKTRPY